ncbi:MAG: hypothetical protein AAGC53_09850 [Actinomycetota bacterium]
MTGRSSPGRRAATMAIAVVLIVGGCASDDATEPFAAVTIVDGLDRPTQLAITDDGWFVAQLNGGEDDAAGQIVRLDPTDLAASPVVVLDGLDKPTGVAVFAGDLWVMEQRRLTRGPLDGSDRTVVVDDMAFNGRSQGTLTVDGDRLLFDTSGSQRTGTGPAGSPTETSGVLWSIDADGAITNVGWGFKHAYAHVRDGNGVLWTTEMSDGSFDDVRALDELVAVDEGSNHGWPSCVDDNRPVGESGVDRPCDGVPRSQATFAAGATPTGLAVAPWDSSQLVVALWVERSIVAVPLDPSAAPAQPVTIVTEVFERPQHLVADGDRLLVTDHEAGTIVELTSR